MSEIVHVCAMHTTGDERLIALLHCPACNQEYIRDWVDAWLEDGSEFVERTFGPLATELGDRARDCMELCPEPDNKFCECPASSTIDNMIQSLEVRKVRACDPSRLATAPAEPSSRFPAGPPEPSRRSLLDRMLKILRRQSTRVSILGTGGRLYRVHSGRHSSLVTNYFASNMSERGASCTSLDSSVPWPLQFS